MPSRYLFYAPVLVIVLSAAAFACDDWGGETVAQSQTGRTESSAAEASFVNSSLFKARSFQSSPQGSTRAEPKATYPGVELFIGYSHVRFGVPGSTSAQSSFDFQGGTISLAYNLNRWLGLVGEASAYKVSSLPSAASAIYLFGPRFSRRIGYRNRGSETKAARNRAFSSQHLLPHGNADEKRRHRRATREPATDTAHAGPRFQRVSGAPARGAPHSPRPRGSARRSGIQQTSVAAPGPVHQRIPCRAWSSGQRNRETSPRNRAADERWSGERDGAEGARTHASSESLADAQAGWIGAGPKPSG